MQSAPLPLIAFVASDRDGDNGHFKSAISVTACHFDLSQSRKTENITDP